MSAEKILVVDDNAGIRGALKVLLPLHFTQVELIASPKELMARMNEFKPNAVLLDMNFHTDINTGNEGLFWLAELKKYFPQTEVVLFTAYADIQLAVEGMKRGAFDFVVKPWDNAKLVEILAKAIQKNAQEDKHNSRQPSLLPRKERYDRGHRRSQCGLPRSARACFLSRAPQLYRQSAIRAEDRTLLFRNAKRRPCHGGKESLHRGEELVRGLS